MNKNYSEPIKKTQLQTSLEEQKTLRWRKIKKIAFGIVIIFSILFFYFSYRGISPFNKAYFIHGKEFKSAKKKSTIALDKVKEYSKGKPVHDNYLKARSYQQKTFDVYKDTIEDNKFLGFDSFHFFWERFGKTTANFIFCLWVVYIFLFAPKATDKITLYCRLAVCVTYLFVQMFTYFWILQKFQDFSQFEYVFTAFAFSFTIIYVLYLLLKNKKPKEEILYEQLMESLKFAFKNTKPEKREEMIEMIKNFAKNK